MDTDSSSEDEKYVHVNVKDFLGTIESYSDSDFRTHFRLNQQTVLSLIGRYI